MPVYEGWKLWKRNGPLSVYDIRTYGSIFLGYVAFSSICKYLQHNHSGIVIFLFLGLNIC